MISQSKGFTLIEILIVVAIMGIVAAFAIPAYQEQMQGSRRAEGIALLNQVMQAQERGFFDRVPRTYQTDLTVLGYPAATVTSQRGYYVVSAGACGGDALTVCVELTATGAGLQATAGDLTLDSRGSKSGF